MVADSVSRTAPLIVSLGEPAGIGPEIILKTWLERSSNALPAFGVMGGANHLRDAAKVLGLDVPISTVASDEIAEGFPNVLPVIALGGEKPIRATFGKPSRDDAQTICGSIGQAVQGCLDGQFSGLVTAPINKKALYEAGFGFPGHTEFLAELATNHSGKKQRAVMMLAGPELRTVPVTIHVALRDAINMLSEEEIVETCRIVATDLRSRFGLSHPHLAVSGLNPHAGENGSMGTEDDAIIAPAVKQLQDDGIAATGPLPADTMFHASARKTYDAAICMYHDQALIPAKTLAFDDAVNVTLGLPFIRTSPDHGTAYNIAGKGIANASSMIAAVSMAGEMAANSTGLKSG